MPHATAKVDGKTIADASSWETVEGNIYVRFLPYTIGSYQALTHNSQFPPSSVEQSFFSKSDTTTFCPWKGTASYYNISVDGKYIHLVAPIDPVLSRLPLLLLNFIDLDAGYESVGLSRDRLMIICGEQERISKMELGTTRSPKTRHPTSRTMLPSVRTPSAGRRMRESADSHR